MRLFTAAVLATGFTFISTTPAHASLAPEVAVRYGLDRLNVANGAKAYLGTTSPGVSFTVAFTVANDGPAGSVLHVSDVVAPDGTTIIEGLPATIDGGASFSLLIPCAGTKNVLSDLTFTTDDTDESQYAIELRCYNDGFGEATMHLLDGNKNDIDEGGTASAAPGASVLVSAGNDGLGTGPLRLGTPTATPAGPKSIGFFHDDVASVGGPPVQFNVSCADAQEQALSGDFLIKVPDVGAETNFAFTLHCAEAPAPPSDPGLGSGGLPATGQGAVDGWPSWRPASWRPGSALGVWRGAGPEASVQKTYFNVMR